MSTTGQVADQAVQISLAGTAGIFAWLLSDPVVYTLVGTVSGALAASIAMKGAWWLRISALAVAILAGMSLTGWVIAHWVASPKSHDHMAVAFALAFSAWGLLRAIQGGLPLIGVAIVDGFKGAVHRLFGAQK